MPFTRSRRARGSAGSVLALCLSLFAAAWLALAPAAGAAGTIHTDQLLAPVLDQLAGPVLDQLLSPVLDQVQPGSDQLLAPVLDAASAAELEALRKAWQEQSALKLIGADSALSRASGRGAQVAIVDSGVDTRHPLFSSLWQNEQNRSGYHGGWTGNEIDLVGDGVTSRAHGTFVTGMVAAVAPGASLLSIRSADATGTTTEARLVSGIRTATSAGAKVINLSMSSPDPLSRAVRDAVLDARAAGAVVIGSVGNRARPTADYPAFLAFGVGATTPGDTVSTFSNRGPGTDLAAPGEALYGPLVDTAGNPAMGTWSGTSFSAGMASGVAALLYEQGLRGQAIEDRLQASARSLSIQPSVGRVDAAAAVGAR